MNLSRIHVICEVLIEIDVLLPFNDHWYQRIICSQRSSQTCPAEGDRYQILDLQMQLSCLVSSTETHFIVYIIITLQV